MAWHLINTGYAFRDYKTWTVRRITVPADAIEAGRQAAGLNGTRPRLTMAEIWLPYCHASSCSELLLKK
jgi:hypothetical protein